MKKISFRISKKQVVQILIFVLTTALTTSIAIILLSLDKTSANALEHVTEHKMTHSECVLAANNKYSDSIKSSGTQMIISGKEVSGLSNEDWKAIDNQRTLDVQDCQSIK